MLGWPFVGAATERARARVYVSYVSTGGDMTIHFAEGPTGVAMRRSLARWSLEVHGGRAPIRYGLSVVCVAVALGVALASQYYGVRDVELPLFELAIVVTTPRIASAAAMPSAIRQPARTPRLDQSRRATSRGVSVTGDA
jgi:hypothetical protein